MRPERVAPSNVMSDLLADIDNDLADSAAVIDGSMRLFDHLTSATAFRSYLKRSS
jgi:hypothetical protein